MNKLKLMVEMSKVSFLSFGGGPASLPIFHDFFSEKNPLISEDNMQDILSLATSLPGPTMVLASSMIGSKIGGKFSAILSVLSVVSPLAIAGLIVFSTLSNVFDITLLSAILSFALPIFAIKIFPMIISFNKVKENSNKISKYFLFIISTILILFFDVNVLYILIPTVLYSLIKTITKGRKNA